MSLDEVIFINNLPTLDLHALTSDEARVKTLEFINDNKILKNEIICIVHGIGSGILKNIVHQTLKANKSAKAIKTP